MDSTAFDEMRNEFRAADLERKIEMYVSAEGLTQRQYKDLLKLFPLNELPKLEAAISW